MAEVTVRKTVQVPVAYLKVNAGVRYWEDGKINDAADEEDEPKMPFALAGRWTPVIRLEDGVILDWPKGVTASIHYKVCDDGIYELLANDMSSVVKLGCYVPEILAPEGDGYGDYIIMEIDGLGKIGKWVVNLAEFGGKEDD